MNNIASTPAIVNPFEAYCERIGAVSRGGGKAVILGNDYRPLTITVNRDGTVSSPTHLAPTPDELIAIKAVLPNILIEKQAIFPAPEDAPNLPGTLYRFNDADNNLLMLTQRIEAAESTTGHKRIIPWAYYAEEGWVPRRPAQLLPLYGNHHSRTRVFLHEGEKAGEAALKAASPSSEHPWREGLTRFGHCAYTGGARAIGHVDWSILKDHEVYILADNDEPGRRAARRIAALLDSPNVYILDQHHAFTEGWDMADPPPADLSFREFMEMFRLATRATNTLYDAKEKPYHVLREEFLQHFAYITTTGEWIERNRPNAYYKDKEFNNAYGHLTQIRNLSATMVGRSDLIKVDLPMYNPLKPTGAIVHENGQSGVNTYRKGSVAPLKDSIRPALTFLRHLMPTVRERKIFLRWAGAVVSGARPPRWGVLLISRAQGVGKSTVADVMAMLIGQHNFQTVGAKLLQEKHNGWAERCQLISIEEINEGRPFQTYETLKPYITNDLINVRRMGVDSYTVTNRMAVIASSNHKSALSIPNDDRRWFIPDVTEVLRPAAFFKGFRDWLNDKGASALLYAALHYSPPLSDRAPSSKRKDEFIERSVPDWQTAIDSITDEEPLIISAQDVAAYIEENLKQNVRTPTVADYLEQHGWIRGASNPASKDPKEARGTVTVVRLKPKQTLFSRAPIDRTTTSWRQDIVWYARKSEVIETALKGELL